MRTINAILTILAILCIGTPSSAQTYQESDSYVSESIIPSIQGLPIVREINGGTVFKVQYSGNWKPEMTGAFEYACKIVAEALPPTLPITVKADISAGTTSAPISKVGFISYEDFSNGTLNEISLASQIKHIVLAEYDTNSSHQFIESISSLDFFDNPARPDIRITYNASRLNECSFSLDETPGQLYDFVSIAIRDLLKGLGYSCSFRLNPSTGIIHGLDSANKAPFDWEVTSGLFKDDGISPAQQATAGSVKLQLGSSNKAVTLYAPSTWADGISLNYFIPDDNYKLTQVLTYNFGKGTVTRDVSDKNVHLFRDLLHWKPFAKSGSQPQISGEGSNGDILPYQGRTSLCSMADDNHTAPQTTNYPSTTPSVSSNFNYADYNFIFDYLLPFHVFYTDGAGSSNGDGWAVSVLKKDGKWDCVYFTPSASPELYIDFSSLTFHHNDEDYARTCEGYLRCRATRSYRVSAGSNPRRYDARYFVMDYLPQAVELGISSTGGEQNPGISAMATTTPVKIGMKNLEGLTRLVLEVKPQGARVPSKIEVTDLKSGVVELQLTSGRTTTITPVSYNANGSVRGEPLTIDLSK